jgi:hypothetical protein
MKRTLPSQFKIDGKIVFYPNRFWSDKFCKYFTNIGINLANKIPSISTSFRTCLGTSITETIWLKPATLAEREQTCMTFKSGKEPGFDNIPMNIINSSFKYISNPLLDLINLSFSKGVFPDQLKIAKLIPVFKADDPELFSNYRPISLLTNFSKYFEKIMHNRLVFFAERFNIFYHN